MLRKRIILSLAAFNLVCGFVLEGLAEEAALPAADLLKDVRDRVDQEKQRLQTEMPNDTKSKAEVVYAESFDNNPTGDWSSKKIDVTPRSKDTFLGPFDAGQVTLKLDDLPKHRMVRLQFDLFVMNSWDGTTDSYGGPDIWEFGFVDQRPLIYTTFNLSGLVQPENTDRQSFPDRYPHARHAFCTGALKVGQLGYQYFSQTPGKFHDAVYRFELIVPHESETISLQWKSHSKEHQGNEPWGLDNVSISVLAGPIQLKPSELEQCWNDLASTDPIKANVAKWRLVATGDQAVSFLRKQHTNDTPAKDPRPLFEQLDHDEYTTRERAMRALVELGPEIIPQIKQRLAQKPSPEVKWRLESVLASLIRRQFAEADLRSLRVADALQIVNTTNARKLLDQLGLPVDDSRPSLSNQ